VPRVKVRLLATLYQAAGRHTIDLEVPEGATILDVLRAVVEEYPQLRSEVFEENSVSGDLRILVDGRPADYLPGGLARKVEGGEEITLIPPAGGGDGSACDYVYHHNV